MFTILLIGAFTFPTHGRVTSVEEHKFTNGDRGLILTVPLGKREYPKGLPKQLNMEIESLVKGYTVNHVEIPGHPKGAPIGDEEKGKHLVLLDDLQSDRSYHLKIYLRGNAQTQIRMVRVTFLSKESPK